MNALRKHRTPLAALGGAAFLTFAAAGGAHGQAPALTRATPAAKAPDPNGYIAYDLKTLHQGPNIVRCAVINSAGLSNMCARFLDPEDKPLKGFTLRVSEVGK